MRFLKVMPMLLAGVLLLAFLGCKKGNDVTGTWKNVNLPETIQFKKDMSGVFTVQNSPSLPFKWKKTGEGTVELMIDFKGAARTLYGKVEKDTFVLTGNGEQAVYNRMD